MPPQWIFILFKGHYCFSSTEMKPNSIFFSIVLLFFSFERYVEAASKCHNFGGCDKSRGLLWPALKKGRTYCSCKAGYKLQSQQSTTHHCIDIDECKAGSHNCDLTHGKCVNTVGSHRCVCNDGYLLDYTKTKCLERSKVIGLCDQPKSDSVRLFDFLGRLQKKTPSCKCEAGFELRNGCKFCRDINECNRKISRCDPVHGDCHNTIGGYFCSCRNKRILGPCGYKCYRSGERPDQCTSNEAKAANLITADSDGLNDEASRALVADYKSERAASLGLSISAEATTLFKHCKGEQTTTQQFDLDKDGRIDVTIRYKCKDGIWLRQKTFDQEAYWQPWTCWTECRPTCSGGIQTRTRYCKKGLVGEGGCVGPATGYKKCYIGKVCPLRIRRNANTLTKDQQQDLIQAFRKYKADKTTNGFWSAAGTHFYPLQCRSPEGQPGPCCFHGAKTNFVFWHRAQLLNFEEGLSRYLKDNTLGLPYWDWLHDTNPPELAWAKTYNQQPNPFAEMVISYSSTPIIKIQRSTFVDMESVLTAQDTYTALEGKLMKAHAIHELSQELENAHNSIHVAVCHTDHCQYSMAGLQYAAFDPIFFFHHTNIDRLFAVYQERLDKADETAWTRQTALEPQEAIYHFNEPYNPFRNETLSSFTRIRQLSSLQDLYFHEEMLGYKYDTLQTPGSMTGLHQASTRSTWNIMQYERSIGENVKVFYFIGNGKKKCSKYSAQDHDYVASSVILGTAGERAWKSKEPLILPMRSSGNNLRDNVRQFKHISACYTNTIDCIENCTSAAPSVISRIPSPQLILLPSADNSILFFEWSTGIRMPGWDVNIRTANQWIWFWGSEARNIVQVSRERYSSCDAAGSRRTTCHHTACLLPSGLHYFIHTDSRKCNVGLKISFLSVL